MRATSRLPLGPNTLIAPGVQLAVENPDVTMDGETIGTVVDVRGSDDGTAIVFTIEFPDAITPEIAQYAADRVSITPTGIHPLTMFIPRQKDSP